MENNKVLTVTLIVAGFLIGILSLMIYFRKDLVRLGGKFKDYFVGGVVEEKVEEKPLQGRYDPVLIQTLLDNINKFEVNEDRRTNDVITDIRAIKADMRENRIEIGEVMELVEEDLRRNYKILQCSTLDEQNDINNLF